MPRHCFAALALLLLSLPALAADKPDALKQLAGTWEAVSMERGREKSTADQYTDAKLAKLVVEGDQLILTIDGEAEAVYKLRLPAVEKGQPAAIDLTSDAGADEGTTLLGIYKVESKYGADVLTLWVLSRPKPEERPKEFAWPEGSDNTLVVAERTKK